MKFHMPAKIKIPLPKFLSKILSTLANNHAIIISLILWILIIFSLLYFTQKDRPSFWTFVQNTIPGLSKLSPQPSPSPEPHSDLKRIAETQKVIQESINNKKVGDISPYLKDKVDVKRLTEKCCGEKDQKEVMKNLTNLNPNVPFDFNQNSELIFNLRTKNPELAEKFIGVATPKPKEQLVAFEIQPDGKISQIQIAVSWKLFKF